MVALLNWSLVHWYVFFWLAVFGVLEGVRDFFVDIAEAIGWSGSRRRERKLQLAKAEAIAAVAEATAAIARAHAEPGRTLPAAPCRHRNVVSVRDRTETVVAWLCRGCGTRLPADFSVYEEDL